MQHARSGSRHACRALSVGPLVPPAVLVLLPPYQALHLVRGVAAAAAAPEVAAASSSVAPTL